MQGRVLGEGFWGLVYVGRRNAITGNDGMHAGGVGKENDLGKRGGSLTPDGDRCKSKQRDIVGCVGFGDGSPGGPLAEATAGSAL